MLLGNLPGWLRAADDVSNLPAPADTDNPIGQYLRVAQAFYVMGRVGLAFRAYDQALALDPDNIQASVGEARICDALQAHDLNEVWLHLFQSSLKGLPTYRKLASIILPQVDFRATPIAEAIEYLRRESFRLNPSTRDVEFMVEPRKKGIGISGSEPTISLTFKNVPLLEAARYVAFSAGLTAVLHESSLHFVPKVNCYDDAPSAEFDLTPEVLGPAWAVPATPQKKEFLEAVVIRGENPQKWFEAHGVHFVRGGLAHYSPSSRKLAIRSSAGTIIDIHNLLDP